MVSTKLLTFIAITTALGFVRSAPISPPTRGTITNQDVCTTPQCQAIAAGFIHDMDPNVNPCENFEQFTCGGFLEKTQLPPGKLKINPMSIINDQNSVIIREISDVSLGKAPQAAPGDLAAASNLKKLHGMWDSCMDVNSIAKRGRDPIVNQINAVISTIPDVTASMDGLGLTQTIVKLIKLSVEPFINLKVESDLYNPSAHVITVTHSGLTLPIGNYDDPDMVAKLEGVIALSFQKIFGAPPVAGSPDLTINDVNPKWIAAAKNVAAFQTAIANTIKNAPASSAPGMAAIYNPWTIARLNTVAPSIKWDLLISELLPAGETYNRPLIASSPDYFTGLEALLKVTPAETFRYYAAFRIIEKNSINLAEGYSMNTLLVSREDYCVDIINTYVGQIAGHYFVDYTLPEHSKIYFKSIISQILASYGESIPKLDWLDPTTLAGAVKKLGAIFQLIAESSDSPNTDSSESLQEYYKDLAIDPLDFYGNVARGSMWNVATLFAAVNKPVSKGFLPEGPPQNVNAFYDPTTNGIYFPAGILRSPLFDADQPEYMNYGGMGVVAGHEIGHGFDNRGKEYDSTGNYTNWWTVSTETKFNQKAQCIVHQYDNFTISDSNGKPIIDSSGNPMHVNGEQTLGENIADNGGVKYAFQAWKEAYASDPQGITRKNYKLPGLEKYTPEQLFFISYGRIWCEKNTPERLVDQINTDDHSPAKWRIIGGVQNSPDFAKAFGCQPNSLMNPVDKCSLW
ncbi:hypothetical protein FBU30_006025 [Linnemannia zychae]|nr:hypothetical protein FBU30_006025 [Linnemannia zychae]